jgi:hypothetical protein
MSAGCRNREPPNVGRHCQSPSLETQSLDLKGSNRSNGLEEPTANLAENVKLIQLVEQTPRQCNWRIVNRAGVNGFHQSLQSDDLGNEQERQTLTPKPSFFLSPLVLSANRHGRREINNDYRKSGNDGLSPRSNTARIVQRLNFHIEDRPSDTKPGRQDGREYQGANPQSISFWQLHQIPTAILCVVNEWVEFQKTRFIL